MASLPITITVRYSEEWPKIIYDSLLLSLVVWRCNLGMPAHDWLGWFREWRALHFYYVRVGGWEWLRTNLSVEAGG